ncbi:MAG: hypothetical protein J6D00_01795 [Christensenellaceae bacterium]|nr:hypothetical protein [Christensenellaceae bacterium]MBR3842540.1 hypothetical protein [Christensenellaceae bacterium]
MMMEKDLKRLNRAELLELLLVQTKEVERLSAALAEAEKKLAERELKIEKAGTLAEASLLVNGVFEACEAAAAQYLENIKRMQEETAARCEEIINEAYQKAEQISENNEMIKKLMGDYYSTTNEEKINQEF